MESRTEVIEFERHKKFLISSKKSSMKHSRENSLNLIYYSSNVFFPWNTTLLNRQPTQRRAQASGWSSTPYLRQGAVFHTQGCPFHTRSLQLQHTLLQIVGGLSHLGGGYKNKSPRCLSNLLQDQYQKIKILIGIDVLQNDIN